MADELWISLQNHIADFVNQNGGQAGILTPDTYRPDWNMVKDVLDGRKPLSTLSSDCPNAYFSN